MPTTNAYDLIPPLVANQRLTQDQSDLVVRNLPLAYKIAGASGMRIERDDKVQTARLGLCEAARRWAGDPLDVEGFGRYASAWVRGQLSRENEHGRKLRRGDRAAFESSLVETVVFSCTPWMRRRSEWADCARVRLRAIISR